MKARALSFDLSEFGQDEYERMMVWQRMLEQADDRRRRQIDMILEEAKRHEAARREGHRATSGRGA